MPCTVVTFIADKGFTMNLWDHCRCVQSYFEDVDATTPHFPFTHPQWPAPQSIGPSQLIVHITVHTPFSAVLMQLVG